MSKSSQGLSPKDYESVGTSFDGIRILKPVSQPTSFTTAQIRAAVQGVLAQHDALKAEPPDSAKSKRAKRTKLDTAG